MLAKIDKEHKEIIIKLESLDVQLDRINEEYSSLHSQKHKLVQRKFELELARKVIKSLS